MVTSVAHTHKDIASAVPAPSGPDHRRGKTEEVKEEGGEGSSHPQTKSPSHQAGTDTAPVSVRMRPSQVSEATAGSGDKRDSPRHKPETGREDDLGPAALPASVALEEDKVSAGVPSPHKESRYGQANHSQAATPSHKEKHKGSEGVKVGGCFVRLTYT